MNEIIEHMRKTYHYDSDTGALTYKARPRTREGAPVGRLDRDGYIKVMLKTKMYMAHRIVWMMHTGAEPAGELDHINGDKQDNRIENLRIATRVQNSWNRNRSHALRKVRRNAHGRFIAQIRRLKKTFKLGDFETLDDANTAYELASILLYKDFSPYFPPTQRAAQAAQGGEQ